MFIQDTEEIPLSLDWSEPVLLHHAVERDLVPNEYGVYQLGWRRGAFNAFYVGRAIQGGVTLKSRLRTYYKGDSHNPLINGRTVKNEFQEVTITQKKTPAEFFRNVFRGDFQTTKQVIAQQAIRKRRDVYCRWLVTDKGKLLESLILATRFDEFEANRRISHEILKATPLERQLSQELVAFLVREFGIDQIRKEGLRVLKNLLSCDLIGANAQSLMEAVLIRKAPLDHWVHEQRGRGILWEPQDAWVLFCDGIINLVLAKSIEKHT